MSEEIVFTLRLTSDDWDQHLRGWRCPAFDIPSTFIKEARDAEGHPIAIELLKVDKGPSRITWSGQDQPSQMAVVIGLREALSLTTKEIFWKRFAIIVPIITAVVGALATYKSKPAPSPSPHTLQLHILPNDGEAPKLSPAKITVNGQDLKQPIKYEIVSDTTVIVDVTKAFDAANKIAENYESRTSILASSLKSLGAVLTQLENLNDEVKGDICPNGSQGSPSPVRTRLSNHTIAITGNVKNVTAALKDAFERGNIAPR